MPGVTKSDLMLTFRHPVSKILTLSLYLEGGRGSWFLKTKLYVGKTDKIKFTTEKSQEEA